MTVGILEAPLMCSCGVKSLYISFQILVGVATMLPQRGNGELGVSEGGTKTCPANGVKSTRDSEKPEREEKVS